MLTRTVPLLALLTLTACSGSGELLRSMLGPPSATTPGFTKGKVGKDGTPVKRTPYGSPHIQSGENYAKTSENAWVDVSSETTSTFGVDVDNGSYTLMRDDVLSGRLPHPDGVRPEEYINYFDYGYAPPEGDDPFSIDLEVGPSPFGDRTALLKVGLQAGELAAEDMRPTNLVFLIDTSGSMNEGRKLPMVKRALFTLLKNLRPSDTVGIVTYAGGAGVLLPPTEVAKGPVFRQAIGKLAAGGSTNGEGGIVEAYRLAEQARVPGGNNRVVLATDGDFNVGRTGDALLDLIREYRRKSITITTVGFGRGNFNDDIMESIAREGNGNYFYVDHDGEAERIFGTELTSTLQVVATDVKVQVAFDPTRVRRYRLIGYENRVMQNEDFANDQKDAGDIGAGHTVTALYELELVGSCEEGALESESVVETDSVAEAETRTDGPWEETEPTSGTTSDDDDEGQYVDCAILPADPEAPLATVRLRHKPDFHQPSQLFEVTVLGKHVHFDVAEMTPGYQFAAAVAEYAEIMRASQTSRRGSLEDVLALASHASEGSPVRQEFVGLVERSIPLYDER